MSLHINRVRDPEYVVYTRRRGARTWQREGSGTRRLDIAAARMGRALANDRQLKRAAVLLCEREPSYYDPIWVLEAHR